VARVCHRGVLWFTLVFVACSSSGEDNATAHGSPEEGGLEDAPVHEVDAAIDIAVAETADEVSIRNDGALDGEASTVDAEAPIACNDLQTAWGAFVEANNACEGAEQCIVIGGAGTCGCGRNLTQGSGDAISASARGLAEKYFTRYDACVAAGHHFGCLWDAAPARTPRCESRRCKVDQRSCIEFDAGPG
jgi:hypothetical protein